MSPTPGRQFRDTHVDVKLVLSAMWVAMMFLFAYVDIFGFFRADLLEAALDRKVAATGFEVDQAFLALALIYVVPPILMIVLSLLLRPRVNRLVNIVVSVVYAITVIGSCIGEEWVYYLMGSALEVILLAAIAWTAWRWPPPDVVPVRPAGA